VKSKKSNSSVAPDTKEKSNPSVARDTQQFENQSLCKEALPGHVQVAGDPEKRFEKDAQEKGVILHAPVAATLKRLAERLDVGGGHSKGIPLSRFDNVKGVFVCQIIIIIIIN
jgi:hypothetical protein